MPIVLRSEQFWEGPEQILDAVEVTTSNDAGTLFLLQPDGLMIRKKGADSGFKVEIPSAQAATRIPFGSVQGENACRLPEFSPCVAVMLNGHICAIALETRTVGECHVEGALTGRVRVDLTPMFSASLPTGRGRPIRTIQSHCGDGTLFLSTGTGDYTELDSVQALDGGGAAVSNELDFPGPVVALNVSVDAPTTATAVVRNLKSDNYEAYRLSVSCGQ
jgi:hypothetical protein